MSELLPCPFCGDTEPMEDRIEPHTHYLATFMDDYPGCWLIECLTCGSGKMSHDSREDAVKAWNLRVKPAPTEYATDAEIIEISTLYGGSKFSSTDEHCISFEVSQFLAFARSIAGSHK